jgi:hypothetical protein
MCACKVIQASAAISKDCLYALAAAASIAAMLRSPILRKAFGCTLHTKVRLYH